MLTYEEWVSIWEQSGKLQLRGKGRGLYCMARYGDKGPYSLENVFITLNECNLREGNLGRSPSAETREKISKANKGISHPWSAAERNPMHRPEVKAKMSAKIGGANHYKARGVITPFGQFETAKQAAEAIGMPKATVEWRARHNKAGFSYGSHKAA